MKRKTLTIAISIFALIAIVSVGFASWIISRPTLNENIEGNITVESVTLSSTNVIESFSITSTNKSLHLGKPESIDLDDQNKYLAADDMWFSYDTGSTTDESTNETKPNTQVENLEVTIKLVLSEALNTSKDTLTLKLEVGKLVEIVENEAKNNVYQTGNVEFNSAVSNNYIGTLTIEGDNISQAMDGDKLIANTWNVSDSKQDGEGDNAVHYVEFKVKISWGSIFSDGKTNLNPYYYYNLKNHEFNKDSELTKIDESGNKIINDGKEVKLKYWEHANKVLSELSAAMENAMFKVNVTLAAVE